MDKKSLILLFSLTLGFWAVNFYFDSLAQEKRAAYIEQQQREAEVEWDKIQEAKKKFRSPPSYSLINTYLSDETTPYSYAFAAGNSLIPLSFDDPSSFPQSISDNHTLYDLRGEKGEVGIYAKSTDPFAVITLPTFGHHQLWLLALNSHGEPHLYPTSYSDGTLTVFENRLYELSKQLGKSQEFEPISKGLLLYPQKDQLIPIGFYNVSTKKLLSLKEAFSGLTKEQSLSVSDPEQKSEYAILENPYLQLVFSTTGGALTEINLPFASSTNTKSVVKPVEHDRMIEEDSPQNNFFPLHPIAGLEPHQGGYYPLIRRDLIKQEAQNVRIPPECYALNIVSERESFSKHRYKIANKTKDSITFIYSGPTHTIKKTYTLPKEDAPYCFEVHISVEGDTRDLWLTTGVPEAELISGTPVYAFKYRITRNDEPDVHNVSLPEKEQIVTTLSPDWISNSNAFFGIILDPLGNHSNGYRVQHINGQIAPSRLSLFSAENSSLAEGKLPGYNGALPLDGKQKEFSFRVFAGPLSTPILKQVDALYSNKQTGYDPDYVLTKNFHGWFVFITQPISKLLYFLMTIFHAVTHSWGLSIILLTAALRLMLYPLSSWSSKAMAKQSEIAPKLEQIKQKYKSNPKKLQAETFKLYKESGVNPLSGCFVPMLIQMPFLMGMYDLLKSSFQLRGASFIPGWIDDLSSPDILFSWGVSLPLIGKNFHLLPILLGAIMFLQPRVMQPLPDDPNKWTEQQRQARSMGTMMSVVFTFMFYNLPAGLNLYWMFSMLLSMIQQLWTQRKGKTASVVNVENSKKTS